MASISDRIAAVACVFAVALAPLMLEVRAGEMNGPMSSTRPPDAPSTANPAPPANSVEPFDVEKLFANVCGWCHSNGGRAAGKGPQLMGTTLTDAEIVHRIKTGKQGAMPAFASAFTDEQIAGIVRYIRNLKNDGAPK